jgi:hypothetical protein
VPDVEVEPLPAETLVEVVVDPAPDPLEPQAVKAAPQAATTTTTSTKPLTDATRAVGSTWQTSGIDLSEPRDQVPQRRSTRNARFGNASNVHRFTDAGARQQQGVILYKQPDQE